MKKRTLWYSFVLLMPVVLVGITNAATVGDYPLLIGAYTDSTTDNTWATDAATYPLLEDWYREGSASGGLWGNRVSSVGIDDDVMEGNAYPQLTMTVTGLDNTKTYDVYAVYWAKTNPADYTGDYFGCWSALSGQTPVMFDNMNYNVDFYEQAPLSSVDGCEGLLGQVSGVTEVAVDFYGTVPGIADLTRIWFDGLSVVETTTVRSTYTVTMNVQIQDPNNFMTGTYTAADFNITPSASGSTFVEDQNVTFMAQDSNPCPDKFVFDHWIDVAGVITDTTAPVVTVRPNQNMDVTAVYTVVEYEKVCGDECHPIPAADYTGDCLVDLSDLAMLVADWLTCTQPACD